MWQSCNPIPLPLPPTESCLSVDPSRRPSVDEITAQLFTVSDTLREDLERPCSDLLERVQPTPGEAKQFTRVLRTSYQ